MKKIIISSLLVFIFSTITYSNTAYATVNENIDGIADNQIEIKIDSIIIDLFEQALASESKLVGARYKTEKLKHPLNDFWKFTKLPTLAKSSSYRFVKEGEKDMIMTLDVFKLMNKEIATQLIDIYCNIDSEFGEVNTRLKGSKTLSNESVPYRTFCVNSYIFVLDCSPKAFPITENTFDAFIGINNEIPIDGLDFIPAQRNYIENDIVQIIAPVISQWLKFYNLDIINFVGHKFDTDDNKQKLSDMTMERNSPYFMEYNKKEWDIYDLLLYDYSPNQKYYINFLPSAGAYLDKDNKYYYFGSDENQTIYLVNRQNEKIALLKWQESAKYADAAFWIDDNSCVIVGRADHNSKTYFIECFGEIEGYYEFRSLEKAPKETYLLKNLKSRGIQIEK